MPPGCLFSSLQLAMLSPMHIPFFLWTALPLACVASLLPWPFPHRQVPWDHGVRQHTYDELKRFAKYSSAVYQFICPRPLGNPLVDSVRGILLCLWNVETVG
ncbi:hypothetical protein OF83DRAFT_1180060 [Amylostereum chailletii]|nr:hypothetical protein OF83DRAFT_1180060 [Amylostereum chailletii]